MDEGNALSIKELAINGRELKELGVEPGPQMGEILRSLLDAVLEDPELNTKEKLKELVQQYTS